MVDEKNVFTVEIALQNIDNAMATVQADRNSHVLLQNSFELVKANLVIAQESLKKAHSLESEITRLKGLLDQNQISYEKES